MLPDRIDFSPLDPSADRLHWERLVASVMARAGAELSRRAAQRTPLVLLAWWAKPALSAAAVIAAIAIGTLVFTEREMAEPERMMGIADALEVPPPVDAWLVEERDPTMSDVIMALDDQQP